MLAISAAVIPPGAAAMMSGTTSWRGGDPGWPPRADAAVAVAVGLDPGHGVVPPVGGMTCVPARGRLTDIPAASALALSPAPWLPGAPALALARGTATGPAGTPAPTWAP